ncbi:hypothetical protein KCU95_g19085, partial [Aureobasidium melanogenum]
MTNKQPSENEIWDDSALVHSWNEALEEYKKYHSMSARGERVEDVLDAVEKEEEAKSSIDTKTENVDTTTGLPPWETIQESTVEGAGESVEGLKEESNIEPVDVHPIQNSNHNQAPPGVAQVLLDSVQDENLKALMTSWYFAGYYTGLYEGQRKAQAAQERPTH